MLYAFPPRSKGRINMVTWVHLQTMLKLADTAFWFIETPRRHLQRHWPDVQWPESLVCFAVEAPAGTSPLGAVPSLAPGLAEDMNRWANLARAVLLHDLAGNHRPIAICHTGQTEFHALDGGGSFGGEYWNAQTLRTFSIGSNPMARAAGWADAYGRPDPRRSPRIQALLPGKDDTAHSRKWDSQWQKAMKNLTFYLEHMLQPDDASAARAYLDAWPLRTRRWN